jgi:cysteine desulfurase/selenocysteine lyase
VIRSDDETFWREYRAFFPALAERIYLNNASIQPMPLPVADRLHRYVDAACRGNPEDLYTPDAHAKLRETFARWIGCEARDLAFVSSTSDGFIKAVNAVDWRPGDQVVIPYNEFPSVVYPFEMARAQGAEVRFAGSPGGVTTEEHILEALTSETRAVAFSWVSFSTGHKMDLVPFSRELKARGVDLVFVDGMQGAGVWNPTLAEADVDFFSFQAVKWIAGPNGIGALYISPTRLEKIHDSAFSWFSVPCCEDYGLLTRTDLAPFTSARRFDGGTPVMIAAAGVQAYFDLLEPVGIAGVSSRMDRLLDCLRDKLSEAGISAMVPLDSPHRSSLVLLEVEDAPRLHERLRQASVITSLRMGRIRVSPHVYNSGEDFDRLIEVVREAP